MHSNICNFPKLRDITKLSRNIFDHLPQIICWKDQNSVFLGCNKTLAKVLNLRSSADIVGKRACDILMEGYDEIEKDDQIALETKTLHWTTRILHYTGIHADSVRTVIAEGKIMPLFDENEHATGVLCIGNIREQNCFKNVNKLFDAINSKNMPKLLRGNKFRVETKMGFALLSRREAECILYLMKNHNTKQISSAMNISPRTVDNYIDTIRGKLNLKNRHELINFAMNDDFLSALGLNIKYFF